MTSTKSSSTLTAKPGLVSTCSTTSFLFTKVKKLSIFVLITIAACSKDWEGFEGVGGRRIDSNYNKQFGTSLTLIKYEIEKCCNFKFCQCQ